MQMAICKGRKVLLVPASVWLESKNIYKKEQEEGNRTILPHFLYKEKIIMALKLRDRLQLNNARMTLFQSYILKK